MRYQINRFVLRRGVICRLSPQLIEAVRKVAHKGATAAEADDLYETLRNASPAA